MTTKVACASTRMRRGQRRSSSSSIRSFSCTHDSLPARYDNSGNERLSDSICGTRVGQLGHNHAVAAVAGNYAAPVAGRIKRRHPEPGAGRLRRIGGVGNVRRQVASADVNHGVLNQ